MMIAPFLFVICYYLFAIENPLISACVWIFLYRIIMKRKIKRVLPLRF